ncbi:hypothetical protein [Bosea sp. F3-2]|uniref:hypothetical protein n=1 Tax=Bosea sp. F3-2 TaxID=2599640 RepID=UPI001654EC49
MSAEYVHASQAGWTNWLTLDRAVDSTLPFGGVIEPGRSERSGVAGFKGSAADRAIEFRSAQSVSANPRSAGSVTAGKSRGMTAGEQIPTATSQKWKSACAQSQDVAAAHSPTRRRGVKSPRPNATPRNIWIIPMSRMKCWLKKPVSVTPGTSSYQASGAISMKRPFAVRKVPLNATMMTTIAAAARPRGSIASHVKIAFINHLSPKCAHHRALA